jgi:hypothetical protein
MHSINCRIDCGIDLAQVIRHLCREFFVAIMPHRASRFGSAENGFDVSSQHPVSQCDSLFD